MKELLVVASLLANAHATSFDVSSAVNSARLRDCGGVASRGAVRTDPKLQKAAGRLAGGAALHEALAAEGYLASQTSVLHFSEAPAPPQIARALSSHYCSTLSDPNLLEVGAARRGHELWIVLAAPVALPATADAASVRKKILDLVNAARVNGRRCGARYFPPVKILMLNDTLNSAALVHSREMAKSGEFDHRGHDGSTPSLRVRRAGYGLHRIVGENIAAGPMSPAEAVEGWLASPAHCENIMDGRFTETGIAYAQNLNSAAGVYWTQDFAAPR